MHQESHDGPLALRRGGGALPTVISIVQAPRSARGPRAAAVGSTGTTAGASGFPASCGSATRKPTSPPKISDGHGRATSRTGRHQDVCGTWTAGRRSRRSTILAGGGRVGAPQIRAYRLYQVPLSCGPIWKYSESSSASTAHVHRTLATRSQVMKRQRIRW